MSDTGERPLVAVGSAPVALTSLADRGGASVGLKSQGGLSVNLDASNMNGSKWWVSGYEEDGGLSVSRRAMQTQFRNQTAQLQAEAERRHSELTRHIKDDHRHKMLQLKRVLEVTQKANGTYVEEIIKLRRQVNSQEIFIAAMRNDWNAHSSFQTANGDLAGGSPDGSGSPVNQNDRHAGGTGGAAGGLDAAERGTFESELNARNDLDLQTQEDAFSSKLEAFSASFEDYKAQAERELQLLSLINLRQQEGLHELEEERVRHAAARTVGVGKPTPAIGPAGDPPVIEECVVHGVDEFGLSFAWRNGVQPVPHATVIAAHPIFRVIRNRQLSTAEEEQPGGGGESLEARGVRQQGGETGGEQYQRAPASGPPTDVRGWIEALAPAEKNLRLINEWTSKGDTQKQQRALLRAEGRQQAPVVEIPALGFRPDVFRESNGTGGGRLSQRECQTGGGEVREILPNQEISYKCREGVSAPAEGKPKPGDAWPTHQRDGCLTLTDSDRPIP
uniref:Uncharacterized protein n=1 Tax=Chromera velia CCMP2878 TaxID=1169474 RepID=A0A0G4HJF1_9ALVE|eukprot:Cvel_7119.t1-p1 / transcript=Cvel_7119.t1 / gene=Cvel_7119 / organism=Chromera_velia_CCMP2878 / gene_product=hypothetical protein / transcript_product=hypothetical protein / location=Cvel_scaffold365:32681-40433(+) / protein_length=503 / sequence_SO=supercontig / SO=protein_coding / is_pseudo=false